MHFLALFWGVSTMIGHLFNLLLGITLFVLGLIIGNGKKSNELRNLLSKGINARERLDFNTAIINFSKAIELDPNCLEAYFQRACIFSEQQKYTEAIEDFTKIIECEPKNHLAYLNRGIANEQLKKFQESMVDYTKAMNLSSKDHDIVCFLHKGIYHRLNTPSQTNKNQTKNNLHKKNKHPIERDSLPTGNPLSRMNMPKDRISFMERGKIHESQKKYHEATLDYTKAIELGPDEKNAYKLRGNLYITQQKFIEAISDYNKVIELSPKKESCDYNLRGKLFEKSLKHQEAFNDYTIAIELNPNEAEYYLNRGKLLKLMGKTLEAENDFAKAGSLKNQMSRIDA